MLNDVERDMVRKAAWAIVRVLIRDESTKGGDYWQGVYQELIRIAETGEP